MRNTRSRDNEKYKGTGYEKYKGRNNEWGTSVEAMNVKYKGRTEVVQYLSVMQTYWRNTDTAVLAPNLTT